MPYYSSMPPWTLMTRPSQLQSERKRLKTQMDSVPLQFQFFKPADEENIYDVHNSRVANLLYYYRYFKAMYGGKKGMTLGSIKLKTVLSNKRIDAVILAYPGYMRRVVDK